jgi:hypothetical protein
MSDAIVHKEIAITIPHTQQHSDPVLPAFHLHNPSLLLTAAPILKGTGSTICVPQCS